MIIEMHSHTSERSSCSHVKAADLVARAFKQGLQGIVLTDHHDCWAQDELEEVRRDAQVPKYFLVFSGQEVTTRDFGDVLVYGADRIIARGTPLDEIRRQFPSAALVWAHPYRGEKIPLPAQLLDRRLDAVEIFNSNHTYSENYRGLKDWHRHRFTAVAGTDTHAASYTGAFPTLFDHPVHSVEELAAELRKGRCRPYFKEIPREGSNIQITELRIGADGAPEETIIVKELEEKKWESADRAFHIMQELIRHGFEGRFRVPKPLSQDTENRILIEEGIRGRTLFDALLSAGAENARRYLRLTAEWLARLHNCRLRITGSGEYMKGEPGLLGKYVAAFSDIDHPFTRRARELAETILQREVELFADHSGELTQGHGDFNPKNILIGHDDPDDPASAFVAVIDFDNSHVMLPSFDVGTFLAQFRNQFFHHGDALHNVSERFFLDSYLESAENSGSDFLSQVELYRARANMEIAYYLIKVGLGESENLWRVLVESDQALTGLAFRGGH